MEGQRQVRRRQHTRARICQYPVEGEWYVPVLNAGVPDLLVALNLIFKLLGRLFDFVLHTIECLSDTGICFLFGVLVFFIRERCIEAEECFNPEGWDRFRDVDPLLNQAC